MSMSDCEKCWETPCSCGWDYRNWSKERLRKLIEVLKYVESGKYEKRYKNKQG